MLIKGILSFPTLFVPKVAKGATVAKYSISVLLPPNDPQVAVIQAEVDAAKLNTFPSGYTGTDECLLAYDVKYAGKEYHDPKFSGWFVFSCNVKEEQGKPSVVDSAYTPIIDPGAVYPGMVGYVNAGISGYVKGKGGIGGWLNGVMITAEEPPMGRLDNKPSVEQMFASVSAAPVSAPGAPVSIPAPISQPPVAPVAVAPVAVAPVTLQMTAAAKGVTLEQYLATPGWTEQMLIDRGLAIRPSFA